MIRIPEYLERRQAAASGEGAPGAEGSEVPVTTTGAGPGE